MKTINRLFVGIALMCLTSSVNAQIARWLVRPSYDHIEMTDGRQRNIADGI